MRSINVGPMQRGIGSCADRPCVMCSLTFDAGWANLDFSVRMDSWILPPTLNEYGVESPAAWQSALLGMTSKVVVNCLGGKVASLRVLFGMTFGFVRHEVKFSAAQPCIALDAHPAFNVDNP